ncbi:hypothetical protein [Stutzerimonas stutzeri]|uniref:hypothetical protein n=1 Tax=Stutzerimonas stutzeri TaxID=316 RepID=UPI001C8C54B5|nr:hypothetical protein [Stutzerimonas stutzeri]
MTINWSQLKTAEQKAAEAEAAERKRVNAESRAYLLSTDWYVVRMQETGVPIPDDILLARQAARGRVVDEG